jgi:hypothetical protein
VLLDPRISAFGIQVAFASHDVKLQSRLQSLLLSTSNKLNSLIVLHKNNNNDDNKQDRTHDEVVEDHNFIKDVELITFLSEVKDQYSFNQASVSNKKRNKAQDSSATTQKSVYIFPPLLEHRVAFPLNDSFTRVLSNGDVIPPVVTSSSLSQPVESGKDGGGYCDESCLLWQLDIHALNIRNKPSALGSVVGVVKKGETFYASCQLQPQLERSNVDPISTTTPNMSSSGGDSTSLSNKIDPRCSWLRICPCESMSQQSNQKLGKVVDLKVNGNHNYITRVGDMADTSSLRVVLAETSRMVFQISPTPPSHSSSLSMTTSRSGGSGMSGSSSAQQLPPPAGLANSVTDWIYEHLSLWYQIEAKETIDVAVVV